jgi:hypothetical protein
MTNRFESEFNSQVMPAVERSFGILAILSRGTTVSEQFTARRDGVRIEGLDGLGIDVKGQTRDFLIPVASAVLDSIATKPQVNDRIIIQDATGTDLETWEVTILAEGTGAVEAEPGEYDWRCHTRRING